MAKLSARGRKELYRVSLEAVVTDPDRLVTWERTTKALMSDNKVLEKRDVRFKPDSIHPEGQRHSYGWTVRGKLKAGFAPEVWRDRHVEKGWQLEA